MIPAEIKQRFLSEEGYVEVPPMWKDSPEYQILHKKKEEIRKYKWYRGEENINLNWDKAVRDWELLYQKEFDEYINGTFLGYAINTHLESMPHFMNYRSDEFGYSNIPTLSDYHSMKYIFYKFPKLSATILFCMVSFPILIAYLFHNM